MLLPHYLEYSIDAFAKNQEKIQDYMQDTFGNMFPFGQFEEMGKQNVAMFEQAMRMFSPFPDAAKPAAKEEEAAEPETEAHRVLQQQLDALQRQIDAMTGKKSDR